MKLKVQNESSNYLILDLIYIKLHFTKYNQKKYYIYECNILLNLTYYASFCVYTHKINLTCLHIVISFLFFYLMFVRDW